MDTNPSPTPLPNKKAITAHDWLLKEQHRLAEKVGEPLFVTIRIIFDGTFEVDVKMKRFMWRGVFGAAT